MDKPEMPSGKPDYKYVLSGEVMVHVSYQCPGPPEHDITNMHIIGGKRPNPPKTIGCQIHNKIASFNQMQRVILTPNDN